MNSKFIVFEGIDGSGKSTQCSLLYDYILSLNIPLKKLAEPTDGEYGRMIRTILREGRAVPVDEQIRLFIEDRQHDFDLNIKPSIIRGETIVMDRYFYSNAAYQGSEKITPAEIIGRNIARGFPFPDRVYFIDIDPAEAMRRIVARNGSGNTELFEKESFLRSVRDNFLSMADERFLKIDGMLKQHDIFNIIKDDYQKYSGY